MKKMPVVFFICLSHSFLVSDLSYITSQDDNGITTRKTQIYTVKIKKNMKCE